MGLATFQASSQCSVGVELELQIVNPLNGRLVARAKDLIRNINNGIYSHQIKPEITQSMIELNSSVHMHPDELFQELLELKSYLVAVGGLINIQFCGGGTHPFQVWKERKIFPSPRFRSLLKQHGYLAKRFTVFGQHVHIGCASADDAIYLTQALHRYIPQLIALSASSPFYQSVNTSFDSARSNIIHAFPTSGFMPLLNSWSEFESYFQKLCQLNIIEGIKDIYWDIRPKAEYGTVEIRVLDTPLTMKKATMLAAYIQTLSRYILQERPVNLMAYDPMLYYYNRYQASRSGCNGNFVNPYTEKNNLIADDILQTIGVLYPYATELKTNAYISLIKESVKKNDASYLREIYAKTNSFRKVMIEQCQIWKNET